MLVTFQELKFTASMHNGLDAEASQVLLINDACDYIMQYHFLGMNEEECLFNVNKAIVDYAAETISVETRETWVN